LLVEHGASVLIADQLRDSGEKAAADYRARGAHVQFAACDVALESEVEAAVARAASEFGRLDLAVNCAGIRGEAASLVDCTNDNWNRVLAVNLTGVWFCMKHQIKAMLAAGGGAIVNCSSIGGLIGARNIAAYIAAKHGVLGLTKTAALEYAPHSIRVNAVCPGVVDTPMLAGLVAETGVSTSALAARTPLARLGTPAEIASAVLWLLSTGAAFVTGHALVADGGRTLE